MGPEDLKHTISSLVPDDKNVLVSFENSEDAAIYKMNDTEALVQTLDFITPVVDDPYIYGKIAAANSLSDVFAMGGKVLTAMNIVGFDAKNHKQEVLNEILRGGNDKIKECGGVLMGGHTIESPEMYYGLSVTGIIHPDKILKNNSGKIGHVLVLTKPIGLGIITTAIKRDLLSLKAMEHSVDIMESLNYIPSQLLAKYEVSSCTDITGFGLLGHALESTNKDHSLSIDSSKVAFIKESISLCEQGVIPGGSKKNYKYLQDKIEYKNNLNEITKILLCDAQTSGGLLIAMKKEHANEYIKEIEDYSLGYVSIIGEIIPKQTKELIIF